MLKRIFIITLCNIIFTSSSFADLYAGPLVAMIDTVFRMSQQELADKYDPSLGKTVLQKLRTLRIDKKVIQQTLGQAFPGKENQKYLNELLKSIDDKSLSQLHMAVGEHSINVSGPDGNLEIKIQSSVNQQFLIGASLYDVSKVKNLHEYITNLQDLIDKNTQQSAKADAGVMDFFMPKAYGQVGGQVRLQGNLIRAAFTGTTLVTADDESKVSLLELLNWKHGLPVALCNSVFERAIQTAINRQKDDCSKFKLDGSQKNWIRESLGKDPNKTFDKDPLSCSLIVREELYASPYCPSSGIVAYSNLPTHSDFAGKARVLCELAKEQFNRCFEIKDGKIYRKGQSQPILLSPQSTRTN